MLEVAVEVAVKKGKSQMKFTDIFIRNLKPEQKKYYKREAHGFAIKVWPSDAKTWVYIYTFDGKRKEMRLGEYPAMKLADAHTKYNEAFELFKNGRDPGVEDRQKKVERRLADTIEDLVKEYIKKHAKVNKRSWKDDERLLNKEVIPIWGWLRYASCTLKTLSRWMVAGVSILMMHVISS